MCLTALTVPGHLTRGHCAVSPGTAPVGRRAQWLKEPGQTVLSHFGDVGFSRIISLRIRWFNAEMYQDHWYEHKTERPNYLS